MIPFDAKYWLVHCFPHDEVDDEEEQEQESTQAN